MFSYAVAGRSPGERAVRLAAPRPVPAAAVLDQLAWLAAPPAVLGLLVRTLAGRPGLAGPANSGAETTVLFLAIIASLTGAASSLRAGYCRSAPG